MPLLDRCIFIPNTDGGTADFKEGIAVTGYQTMEAAGAINGDTYSYAAQSSDLSQWEVGVGTYVAGSPGTLQRTTIQYNSSGTTAKINFFGGAPQVMLTALASDFTGGSGNYPGNYQYVQPTTGFSQVISSGISTLILDPAGTLASGTVTMQSSPTDGQIVRIKTSQAIAALTIAAPGGALVIGAMPFSMAIGQTIDCLYRAANTTWYL